MALEWWHSVDRDEVLESVRRLIPGGGSLILRGDEYSGRYQAAELATETLETFEYDCIVLSQASRPLSLKGALLSIWEQLLPKSKTISIPRPTLEAGTLSSQEIIDRIVENSTNLNRLAVILIDIDKYIGLAGYEVSILELLTQRVGCPIVITSSSKKDTDWSELKQGSVLELRKFSENDVLRCLSRCRFLSESPYEDLEDLVQNIPRDDEGILPSYTYTMLAAVSASSST